MNDEVMERIAVALEQENRNHATWTAYLRECDAVNNQRYEQAIARQEADVAYVRARDARQEVAQALRPPMTITIAGCPLVTGENREWQEEEPS